MKRDQYDYFFKFVLIGDTCTGKSCLLVRFAVSQLINTSINKLEIKSIRNFL